MPKSKMLDGVEFPERFRGKQGKILYGHASGSVSLYVDTKGNVADGYVSCEGGHGKNLSKGEAEELLKAYAESGKQQKPFRENVRQLLDTGTAMRAQTAGHIIDGLYLPASDGIKHLVKKKENVAWPFEKHCGGEALPSASKVSHSR